MEDSELLQRNINRGVRFRNTMMGLQPWGNVKMRGKTWVFNYNRMVLNSWIQLRGLAVRDIRAYIYSGLRWPWFFPKKDIASNAL